jgi:hypothetical protein
MKKRRRIRMIHRRLASTIIRARLVCGIALAVVATGCSRASSPPSVQQTAASPAPASAIPAAARPPAALVQIGELAGQLFDAAEASDWRTAGEWVQSLNESASALPDTLPKPDVVAQLQSRLADVRESVSAHHRIETMDDANGITLRVAGLAAEYQPPVPYEAVMLGYYGRQLDLGIASAQISTVTQARTDLRATWERFERVLEGRGALDEARRFTDILVQLDGAKRLADFVPPTLAELAEADRIEKLFRSPT